MIVVVGTLNPAKLRSVKMALSQIFPQIQDIQIIGTSVASGVSPQPLSDSESIRGAKTRCLNALLEYPNADYAVGIEGGIQEISGLFFESGWIAVRGKEEIRRTTGCDYGIGASGSYQLSEVIMSRIRLGKELGVVVDELMTMENVKQNLGAMGLVTNGLIPRDVAYVHGIIFAFAAFISDKRLWH